MADMWQMEQGIETAGWKCQAPFAVVTFVAITAGTRARAACFSYTIKQMMPLPEGYEVMMEVTHQNGAKVMEAAKETVFPYCLVLLEGDAGDRIELYNLFPGCGVEEHGESMLVPTRYCEKCGRRMVPHMRGTDETTLYYACECGGTDRYTCGESEEEKTNE